MRRSPSACDRGRTTSGGMCASTSDNGNGRTRSTVGVSAKATAGASDEAAFFETIEIGCGTGADAGMDDPGTGDLKASGDIAGRVAFGRTVLLKRSVSGFAIGTGGGAGATSTGSALRLKRLSSENPIV